MTTGEATKPRSGTLIQSIRSSSWQSWIAVGLIALLLVLLAIQAVREPGQFFSQLVIGITNGAIIALIALGYTLVYGIIELINFAHGDNFMIGSFVGLSVLSGTFLGLGLFSPITDNSGALIKIAGVLIAMAVAMIACGLLGVGIERVAYKPLRNSPRLAVLITAIGMSFILQNVGLVWKGPAQVPFPELISNANILPGDQIIFCWKDLFVIVVTVPLLLVLSYFIQSTKQGKAMRAVAQDKEAAAMVGINVNRMISITFLLGIIGSMADQYIGVEWTAIVIFAVLILVLVFRTQGLLGDRSAVQGGGE
jgi:branched-chain amino acid transport system permease protein